MGHPIPADQQAITPYLVVKGAAEAIDFYKRAFGAEEVYRMPIPTADGSVKIAHAELQISDSKLFLTDEFPEQGAVAPDGRSPVSIHLFVTDADVTFQRAIEAGATEIAPLQNLFWGDRFGKLADPFGHQWSISERLEELTPEQIQSRMAEAMASPEGC